MSRKPVMREAVREQLVSISAVLCSTRRDAITELRCKVPQAGYATHLHAHDRARDQTIQSPSHSGTISVCVGCWSNSDRGPVVPISSRLLPSKLWEIEWIVAHTRRLHRWGRHDL